MTDGELLNFGLRFLEKHRLHQLTTEEVGRLYYRFWYGWSCPRFEDVTRALRKNHRISTKDGRWQIKPRVFYDAHRRPRVPQQQQQQQQQYGRTLGPMQAATNKRQKNNPYKEHTARRNYLTSNKYGIVIESEPPPSNSKVRIVMDTPRNCVIKFIIQNNGRSVVYFSGFKSLQHRSLVSLRDKMQVTEGVNLLPLSPGDSYEVEALFNPKEPGNFASTVSFKFCRDEGKPKTFPIWKDMVIEVTTPLHKELGPEAPYRRAKLPSREEKEAVIEEGVPPNSSQSQKVEVGLRPYHYPPDLKYLARYLAKDSDPPPEAVAGKVDRLRDILKPTSNMRKFTKRFHHLLYLEEIQLEVDIRKYDLQGQTMTQDDPRNKHLLTLQVPGLLENRPSVLYGDEVRVKKSGDNTTVFKGYVHKVELDRVKLSFSKKLWSNFISNMKFDVEFVVRRLLLRLQHRAVDLACKHQLGRLLFPNAAAVANVPLPELRMFDRQLAQNPEQCAAVSHIVAGSSKPAPYLIFGPPGTGKTITLVEAINQICRLDSSVHILACAPTNNACDVLCKRLIAPGRSIFRLYALSRNKTTVPARLLEYSNWDEENQQFVCPAKEELMKYQIIVTTLFTAGRMVSGGIPEGHFTHVFVDEAGQAPETECVIAVAGLLSPEKGQLVLAGDPMQLGPILSSPLALDYGLGLSLLERLMTSNALYQKIEGSDRRDERFVTKLLRNYRSHQSILHVSNQQFYDGELQTFAGRDMREVYCKWEHLPQKNFPVIFHGVIGKENRECSSPSYFNVDEIAVLLQYLTLLFETQGKQGLPKLSAKDVGIITPYGKQVEKIRKALKSSKELRGWTDLSEIKVGCVEEFQGEERNIILVSTVRSSSEQCFGFGFLSNEKRFNVAVTRPKSLLIVVGNHRILSKVPVWEKFINFCVENTSYVGFNPKDLEEEKNLMMMMQCMRIKEDCEGLAEEEEEEEESPLQGYVDPGWKNED